MNREEAIKTIVAATKWLTTAPETHSGCLNERMYVISEEATTKDFCTGVRGVHFGHTVGVDSNLGLQRDATIRLIDHADRASWHDYIPCSYIVTDDDFRLGVHDVMQVDVDRLMNNRSDETLVRMANNALRVMRDYGYTPDIAS